MKGNMLLLTITRLSEQPLAYIWISKEGSFWTLWQPILDPLVANCGSLRYLGDLKHLCGQSNLENN